MADIKISALPAGSTAAGGEVPMVQSAATVKVTLGTMAYQGAGAVAITGGTITGITDLAVADGGTGASSAAAAATNLGLGTGNSPQFTAVNIGSATDTTVSRASAGDIAVEGNIVYRAGGTDVPITDGGTGASSAAAAATNLGLGTGDSPQFTAVNIGSATDTTVSRASAGDIAVEGNIVYRAGGTDVPVTDGGTGVSSLTAYGVVCGGTTTTGAVQSVAVGSATHVLTSNGAGALPSFQALPASGANTALSNLSAVAINTGLVLSANDGGALGASGTAWSDLFLATGGVINWNAGDVTITHAANSLAFAGASSGYTFDAAPLPATNNTQALGASGTAWADLFLGSGAVVNFNAGDVTLTHSSETLTLAGGGLVLPAGTATKAPLVMTSGTNLTSPAAGALEYDGVQLYGTLDTTSGRGIIPVEQYRILTADGSAITSVASFFGATTDFVIDDSASAYYIFEFEGFFLKTTASTITWTLETLGDPPSMYWLSYKQSPTTGLSAPPGAATWLEGMAYSSAGGAIASIVTGSLTTAVNHYVRMRFLFNATATTDQIRLEVASTSGSLTPLKGSWARLRRIPDTAVGNFS